MQDIMAVGADLAKTVGTSQGGWPEAGEGQQSRSDDDAAVRLRCRYCAQFEVRDHLGGATQRSSFHST